MRGPTTHISSLANLHTAYCIQMVNAFDLRDSLDASTDLRPDLGDTMDEHFPKLLQKKYENCSDWFTTNLATLGIQEPLVVIIRRDGTWQMDEGHHRLAWALLNNKDVPVIFDDTGVNVEDSHMGYLVSRTNVDAYHTTIEEDFLDDVESAFADQPVTGSDLAHNSRRLSDDTMFVPIQRGKSKHRAGGRHRLN